VKRQPVKLLLGGDVLGRLAPCAASNPRVEALLDVAFDRIRTGQQQLPALPIQQQSEQVQRFVARFRQPGLAQRGFGGGQQITDAPAVQTSTSCLSRSA
jgi:hypothetical protein